MSVLVPYICYTVYVFDPWSIKHAMLKSSTMSPLFDFEPKSKVWLKSVTTSSWIFLE